MSESPSKAIEIKSVSVSVAERHQFSVRNIDFSCEEKTLLVG